MEFVGEECCSNIPELDWSQSQRVKFWSGTGVKK